MWNIETYHDLDIFLVDIEFILRSNNINSESRDGSSKLKPSIGSSHRVGDLLIKSCCHEGVASKGSVNSWDGDGKFGDEGLERNNGSISNFDGKPVDCWIDNTVLIERGLTVIDCTTQWELCIHQDDEPIMGDKSASTIWSNIEVSVCLTDGWSRLEEDSITIGLVSVGDGGRQHIEEVIVCCQI